MKTRNRKARGNRIRRAARLNIFEAVLLMICAMLVVWFLASWFNVFTSNSILSTSEIQSWNLFNIFKLP